MHVVEVDDEVTEIAPLLVGGVEDAEGGRKPSRMTIFSVSYPKTRPSKESTPRVAETEFALLHQFVSWAWNESRYSGLFCMACSATIYYIMELLMDVFPVRSIPLFQTIFTRCAIISILSVVWLRKNGQPLCAPAHIRNLLIIRFLTGFISLLTFIYSVQNLPLPYAVALNFATPIMASLAAKIILRENWVLPDIGGLAFSFLGLMIISQPIIAMREYGHIKQREDCSRCKSCNACKGEAWKTNHFGKVKWEIGEVSSKVSTIENHPVTPIVIGIFSSITGGISYCLIRAGAKASDQPVYTVFSFAALASFVSAICTLALQEFVMPTIFTFVMMAVLGVLAFFAEVCLARGLQLEKIGKVTNILYIKVLLSQVGRMTLLRSAPSFSELAGCLLMLLSVCSTLYFGPEKEVEL